jgi:hypothetical protein
MTTATLPLERTADLRTRECRIGARAFYLHGARRFRRWDLPMLGNWGDAVTLILMARDVVARPSHFATPDESRQLAAEVAELHDERLHRIVSAWLHGDRLRPNSDEMTDLEAELTELENQHA